MVFSSHFFLFYFLPTALALYVLSPGYVKLLTLTMCSLVFYGWANPWFILVVLSMAIVDFTCGNIISGHWRIGLAQRVAIGPENRGESATNRRFTAVLVGASLAANIGVLFLFKYLMFAQDNFNRIAAYFGHEGTDILVVILPIGISFYTFESISYIIDIYRRQSRPASAWVFERAGMRPHDRMPWVQRLRFESTAFISYTCYLTQFPHLVAGPIIRYKDIESQLHDRSHTVEKCARGIAFFSLGMAKKILLANPVADIADATFSAMGLSWPDAWYGAVAYAFQIYFDFSGYSDMAIGLGLMLGFCYPRNFSSPYLSESITDFWRRWHISLSTWLRDYLYVPLGGNRRGPARTYLNLIVVMLIGGFWHGAAWTFLAWGCIHGLALAGERMMGKDSAYRHLPRAVRIGATFAIVCLAWVFFRSPTIDHACYYIQELFGICARRDETDTLHAILYDPLHISIFLCCAIVTWGGFQTWEFTRTLTPLRAIISSLLLLVSILAMWCQSENPFLYFRF